MSIEFINAIKSAGIAPPSDVIADGTLYRFHVEGDNIRSEDGWYVLHDNPLAGAFGWWKDTCKNGTWSHRDKQTYTHAEKARFKKNIVAAKQQRLAEQTRIHEECQRKSSAIWNQSKPAPASHPYLVRKGVKPNGLRVHKGSLVVPVRGHKGILHGLQFITPEKDELGRDKQITYYKDSLNN